MTPERWQQVEQLFAAALAQPPAVRAEFVRAQSGADTQLQQAVEKLLTADEAAASFLEQPAVGAVAEAILDPRQLPLADGERLAHYEVIKPLGAGGMGEVYLVRDSKLKRQVALKVLSPEFAGNADYLRRFAREAQALSGLNHPNIVTLHEIGESAERRFIVTEWVDGLTLRQCLAGGLALPEILDIATQTAKALAAAHAAGLMHRDIKPENIMRRRDGLVKVLDFGLAKNLVPERAPRPGEMLSQPMFRTASGVALGTAVYMSPEQARCQAVDERTDIWSWGVVLYEMLAGQAPFKRATTVDTLAAVLQQEPEPLAQRAPQTPVPLQCLVERALAKDPAARYATAQELLAALAAVSTGAHARTEMVEVGGKSDAPAATAKLRATRPVAGPTQTTDSRPKSEPSTKRRWAVGAALAVLLLAAFLTRSLWRSAPAPVAQNNQPPPAAVVQQLSYSLTVQRRAFGRANGKPFAATGQEIYGNGDEFWLSCVSPQAGFLYVVNEGPQPRHGLPNYHILFPLHKESARLEANQTLASPPRAGYGYNFDEKEGGEKMWLIFAARPVPELERAKDAANTQSLGELTAAVDIQAVQQFLAQHGADGVTARADEAQERTILAATREPLVYLAQLKHK